MSSVLGLAQKTRCKETNIGLQDIHTRSDLSLLYTIACENEKQQKNDCRRIGTWFIGYWGSSITPTISVWNDKKISKRP